MRRKHENGGTPFRPPLGYKSKRTLIGNQDIRTVVVDKERSHFVQEAFDLYATGNWTTKTLAAHLEQRGLRSRETPRVAARPVKAKNDPRSAAQSLLHGSGCVLRTARNRAP